MKISLITVTFNSSKTIIETMQSVLEQTHPYIEYILVDGFSQDKTIDIVKEFEPKFGGRMLWLSEPDKGIYDAMNKGIQLATGDIIGILNSDDFYFDENVISNVVGQFEKDNCDAVYGDLYYVQKDKTDIIVRKWNSNQYVPNSFAKGWHPPHPTFYVKKEIYKKYGCFNLQFKLAADFELMLRFLEKYKIKSSYIQSPLVKMRLGGATNKSLKNILIQNKECYNAFKINNIPVSIIYPFLRLTPKFTQFLTR